VLKSINTTLENLIAAQRRLIEIADRKRTVLIQRNLADLDEMVQEEGKLLKQVMKQEDELEQQVQSLPKTDPPMSFSQYVEGLSDELMKKKLQIQMNTLQELLVELQEKNRVNDALLNDAMSFVQHMIDQVTKSGQKNFNYQSPLNQQKSQTNNRGFFDTKA
jgi:uncharacterized protein YicC (UPF0701 family)